MSKIEVTQIAKWAPLVGHSFMFPVGTPVFIQRLTVDVEKNVGTYQGMIFKPGRVIEVQFDMDTLAVKGLPGSPGVALGDMGPQTWAL